MVLAFKRFAKHSLLSIRVSGKVKDSLPIRSRSAYQSDSSLSVLVGKHLEKIPQKRTDTIATKVSKRMAGEFKNILEAHSWSWKCLESSRQKRQKLIQAERRRCIWVTSLFFKRWRPTTLTSLLDIFGFRFGFGKVLSSYSAEQIMSQSSKLKIQTAGASELTWPRTTSSTTRSKTWATGILLDTRHLMSISRQRISWGKLPADFGPQQIVFSLQKSDYPHQIKIRSN